MRALRWLVCCSLCTFAAARAQVSTEITPSGGPPAGWSATAGRTVGDGTGVILGQAGWPGISAEYLRGLDAQTDLGFRASLNYGFENTTESLVGATLSVPYRRQLYLAGALGVVGHIDPGISFYGHRGPDTGNLVGVGAPLGLVAGMQLSDRLTIDAGADVDLLVSFANPAGVFFGPMAGVGGEYKLDRDLAFTVSTRFGPEFGVVNGGSGGQFAFVTLVGLAYAVH